ncbi:MAG: FAD-dependent oxidoreductase, partial [Balneolaceae bacterium]
MVIGIIGAGISGLTAGRLLAGAGHEVTIFEKSGGYGGRMATRYAGDNLQSKLDHGVSMFSAESPEFLDFMNELLEKGIVQTWGKSISVYNGENLIHSNPNPSDKPLYTSTDGMNAIGKYLSRWVDVKLNKQVGGLTYFGKNRTKKRPWIINFTSSETFNADAVIIALPARQAYGILSSTIDEINTLKIVRHIDEIHYRPAYSLMTGYGDTETPEWEGIICKKSVLDYISNESAKRKNDQETSFVLHGSESFSLKYQNSDEEIVIREMLTEFAEIAGGWASVPEWKQLHFWKYSRPRTFLNQPYFELDDQDAKLAL